MIHKEDEIQFISGHILIRPCRVGDVDNLYKAVRESITELIPWMSWCHTEYSLKDSRKWVKTRKTEWRKGISYDFVIIDISDESFLGMCGLNHIDADNKVANLGYWVKSSRTNQGIASTVVPLLARFAFNELKLNRVEIITAVGNKASQQVAEKVGALKEGLMRNRIVVRDSIYNGVMYSLIP